MTDISPEDIELSIDQKLTMELFCDDLTETEVAARLDVSRNSVLKRFKTVMKILGVTEMLRRYGHIRIQEKVKYQREKHPGTVFDEPHHIIKNRDKKHKDEISALRKAEADREKAKANKVATHVTRQSEIDVIESGDAEAAILKLLSLAKQSGVNTQIIDALGSRIHRGITEVEMMPEDYRDEDLRVELHKKIRLVLGHIDQATVGGAKLTDLSAMFKTLQEQVQLLEGKPTAILSVDDKNNLQDIAARMQAEMRRREKIIDGDCEEIPEED